MRKPLLNPIRSDGPFTRSAWIVLMAFTAMPASAQWYNDGQTTNAGGLISDWTGQAILTATGTYTTAGSAGAPNNYGVFEHYGQSGTGAGAAFINNGTYNATPNGRDYFFGPSGTAGQQEIAGTSAPVFGELFVQNGAGQVFNISNTNGIDVATAATFQNGITTTVRANTDAGAIRFYDNATYTFSAPGNAQHVNGYVSKVGNDAFTFPVGSGTDLRTLAISAPANAAEVSVAWFAGNPSTVTDPSDGTTHPRTSLGAGLMGVSTAGFWDWIPVTATTNALTVTVSIPDLTGFALAPDLRLAGWNGTQWIDLSGSATASGNTLNSTLSGTVPAGTTITALGIGSVAIPLPVYIAHFSAQAAGCRARLTWNTGVEQGIVAYEAEHSNDGYTFRKIGTVQPNGAGQYSCYHNDPAEGTNYYRLRVVRSDNKTDVSAIATLRMACSAASSISVYPNPATAAVWVSGLQGSNTIRLLTTTGQLLQEVQTNNSQEILSLAQLPPATYVLQVLSAGAILYNRQITKQ